MKYYVEFDIHASASVIVEADSEADAEVKAYATIRPNVCMDCSKHVTIHDVGDLNTIEAQ